MNEQPVTVPIKEIIDEAKDTKSFVFDHKFNAKPGQFLMLWIPGFDEKPFSPSYQDEKKLIVTVAKVGPFTEELFKKKQGDLIGIRGPYGTNFHLEEKNTVMVAGGFGIAPLAFLSDHAKNYNIDFIIGAKNKECLLFVERLKKIANVHIATNDGSEGTKCFPTDILKDLIKKKNIDKVFSCGPEIMLKGVVDICTENNIKCQISLDRYMKCGFGICGQCCVDNLGLRMCKEGPVINAALAKNIVEFGKYHRDASGKRIK